VLIFADEITGDHRSLYVKNVGYGPAMDTVRNIIQSGDLVKTTPNEPLALGCLGQGEKVYAYCATPAGQNAVPITDDPQFKAVLEYDDILGNHYDTTYQHRNNSTPRLVARRQIPWHQVARI
jgi:hypothetical protein